MRVPAIDRRHLLHERLRVLLGHDVDRRRKFHIAAHVIAVRVRVDDRRDWLAGHLFDLVENRLAPAGIFRVDDIDAGRADEDGSVSAAALEHEQIVFELFDFDNFRSRWLSGAGGRLLVGCDAKRQGGSRE